MRKVVIASKSTALELMTELIELNKNKIQSVPQKIPSNIRPIKTGLSAIDLTMVCGNQEKGTKGYTRQKDTSREYCHKMHYEEWLGRIKAIYPDAKIIVEDTRNGKKGKEIIFSAVDSGISPFWLGSYYTKTGEGTLSVPLTRYYDPAGNFLGITLKGAKPSAALLKKMHEY
jgi:hypothetical protein